MAAQVPPLRGLPETRRSEDPGHIRSLPGPDFHDDPALGREVGGGGPGNRPVAGEPVGSAVQRQQRVYQTLRERLDTGELHALSFKTYTPQEWSAQRG